jgi:hypothetical protein
MKITSTVLALALVQSANAFLAPKPTSFNHALASSPESINVGERVSAINDQGTGTGLRTTSGPGSKSSDKAFRPVTVQGGSLRTWSFTTPNVERVQVVLKTEGRPLNSDIDLWQGPDNTPQKMAVYIEDGALRPFNSVIETPRGQNAIAIRNTASMEYPLSASVEAGISDSYGGADKLADADNGRVIQGGAIKTYSFGSPVGSVQILLKTDGRPLNARIELLQGPNNNKQVVDIYTEDGMERPFYAVIETPGSGNVVRLINTATMEYPLTASVEPFSVEPGFDDNANEGAWDQTNDASFFFLGGR